MKKKRFLRALIITALFIPALAKSGWAAENKINYTVEPIFRYSIVDGDREKFREDMWISDRAAGGLQEFNMSTDLKGMKLEAEGRAIVDENDYKLDAILKKEDAFNLSAGFKEFTKYYDGTGGYFNRFHTLSAIELDRRLQLVDGHFFTDFTYENPDMPAFFVGYERHAKRGAMSSLGWNSVVESGITRKISPAWKEVDEVQHTIKFGTEGEAALIKDIHWKVEQKLRYFNEESKREERKFGTTAAQNAIDTQEESPESHGYTTTLLADSQINKWLYVSTATQYEHTHASVWENLTERSAATGTITNYTANTENFFGSTASSNLDTYSWMASLFMDPLKYLSTSAKIKAELKKRNSDSSYRRDITPTADFVIDSVTNSDTSSDYKSLSEGIGIRFTKVPKTVFYADGEFEQIDGRIKEERINWVNASETFSRDTDVVTLRNNLTAGVNWYPCPLLSVSSQYRKIMNKDSYSDREEMRGTVTTAFSAFIDEEEFTGDNVTTKVNIKPYKWIHGTLKYRMRNSDIYTTAESQDRAKAVHDVNTYIASITLIPTRSFHLTGMFSKQDALTATVARTTTTAVIPAYEANVNTAMGSATYIINQRASLEAQYQWTRANNFDDISAFGMPYGIDNTWHRAGTTFRYNIKEDLSTEVMYGYTKYDENSSEGVDNYQGHIIGGKVKYVF